MPLDTRVGRFGMLANNWMTALSCALIAGMAIVGWAQGILTMPSRIENLERIAAAVQNMPERVNALETTMQSMTAKNQADHDLLMHIDATLTQMQRDMETARNAK